MFETVIWNPWHGCKKYSAGCAHCYVYRRDDSIGKDASVVERTKSFDLPVQRDRAGRYKIDSGSRVYACMTSDFFIEEADGWRGEAWDIIRERWDLKFTIITKRIVRFSDCLPGDWGDGWDNVTLCVTCEDQEEFDRRFPVFADLPIKHRQIICEPLLGAIDTHGWMRGADIEQMTVGGESGDNARVCDWKWVIDLRDQCDADDVRFYFKQTGANFRKDGRVYRVPRYLQHEQAKRAGINT